jgi:two-component system response regulator RegA
MNSPELPPSGAVFLVVDDDDRLRPRLAVALEDRGYVVHQAGSTEEALPLLDAVAPEFAVLDLKMPGADGLTLLENLLDRHPDAAALVLTGYGSIATAVDAVKLGAVAYLQKPADADMVVAAIARGAADARSEAPAYEPPSLARAEWEHINRVLEDCQGNVSKAARKLGLHRRTLQRKLQKYPPRS